jgi:hypothetical protein
MNSFPLRLPEALKEAAAAQAQQSGISLNQYIALALAERVGARAEAARYFAARAARVTQADAFAILEKAGRGMAPRDDDRME